MRFVTLSENEPSGPSYERGLVSAIIPTRNSANSLADCIRSLQKQAYRPTQVVVVDGNSSDNTVSVAKELGAVALSGKYGRSSARRVGAANARGEFLFFIDSDQIASNEVVAECVSLSRHLGAGAVRVPERDLASGFWARVRKIDWSMTESDSTWYPRFLSHDVYNQVGMHAVGLEDYMEDRDLYLRLVEAGVRIERCPSPVLNQYGTFNPLQFGISRGRAARDAVLFYQRNRHLNDSVWSVIRPRLVRLVTSRPLEWNDLPYALALPAYVTVAYGPRLIRAIWGYTSAKRVEIAAGA